MAVNPNKEWPDDQIRDRIRGAVVELIPEAAWTEYIDREIKAFFAPVMTGTGQIRPSPFRQECMAVLKEVAATKLREELAKPDWQGFWDNGREMAGERVLDALKTHGAGLFEAMIAGVVQGMMNDLRNRF